MTDMTVPIAQWTATKSSCRATTACTMVSAVSNISTGNSVGAVEHEIRLAIERAGLQVDRLAHAKIQQLFGGDLPQRIGPPISGVDHSAVFTSRMQDHGRQSFDFVGCAFARG
jgi:hypothetical protein